MKVLVPLDGSERSFVAMEKALAMLKPAKPTVTLLCVQEEGLEHSSEDVVQVFDQDEDDEVFPNEASAERMLAVAAERAKEAAGLKVSTRTVAGGVRKAILAEAEGHDLLVMHRLDPSGLKDKLRASATEALARKSRCSVLLVDD